MKTFNKDTLVNLATGTVNINDKGVITPTVYDTNPTLTAMQSVGITEVHLPDENYIFIKDGKEYSIDPGLVINDFFRYVSDRRSILPEQLAKGLLVRKQYYSAWNTTGVALGVLPVATIDTNKPKQYEPIPAAMQNAILANLATKADAQNVIIQAAKAEIERLESLASAINLDALESYLAVYKESKIVNFDGAELDLSALPPLLLAEQHKEKIAQIETAFSTGTKSTWQFAEVTQDGKHLECIVDDFDPANMPEITTRLTALKIGKPEQTNTSTYAVSGVRHTQTIFKIKL